MNRKPSRYNFISDMTDPIHQLRSTATSELDAAGDSAALEAFRIKYLGAKGSIRALTKTIAQQPPDQRKTYGQRVNDLFQEVEAAFQAKQSSAGKKPPAAKLREDVTEPGLRPRLGTRHIISQTIAELKELFGRLGYEVVYGPEVEDEFHNFDALNIPRAHPARDPLDNFYLEGTEPGQAGGDQPMLLRSQTSTVQIRAMQSRKPPVRVITIGRVYRPDTHDATHYSMFHQIELLAVDEGLSFVDLKSTVEQFIHAYLGEKVPIRFVPSFFPFTEPSAEAYVQMKMPDGLRWVELGGCGMVHPSVFQAVGYDPQKYTGFAFGFGIERLVMRKHNIHDIRFLFENDLRFLSQF